MKALISGQAGLAVILGEEPEFRPIGGQPYIGNEADIAMNFAGFPDVEAVEVGSVALADRLLGRSFAVDRAKFLLFMLLDGENDDEGRREIADEIERLVTRYRVKGQVTSELAKVSSEKDELEKAQRLASEFPRITPFLAAVFPNVETGKGLNLVKFDDIAYGDEYLAMPKWNVGKLKFGPYGVGGLAKNRFVELATTRYPKALEKVVGRVVEEARASLGSGQLKSGRGYSKHRNDINSRVFERVLDSACRKIALKIKEAGLDLAPPARAELEAMIRSSAPPTRVHRVATRKLGRRVAQTG